MRVRADYRSRTFDRRSFDLRVKLVINRNGRPSTIHGRTRDLSFSGMGVTLACSVAQGTACLLVLKFPKVDYEVCLPAVVTHSHGSRFGLKFQQLSGEQRLLIQKICKALPAA
jgi:PilZ domain